MTVSGLIFCFKKFNERICAFPVETFKKSRKLSALGMPHFVGSGSHELEGVKHRFIVMPRYGQDIWSIYLKNGKSFPNHTVYRLALQMLDVLDYIHNCTYVHGDLKGANILLKGDSQVYLVDFGLASHYTTNKEYKPDPKKMHNGTIEYTSIDAHYGVPTMRGDLEILGYNLLHWCGGQLPWEKVLNDPVKVKELKEKFRGNAKGLMKECFGKAEAPTCLQNFFGIVYAMRFDEHPNYDKCKKLFLQALKALSQSNAGSLQLEKVTNGKAPAGKSPKTKRVSAAKAPAARPTPKTKAEKVNLSVNPSAVQSTGNSASVTLSTPSKNDKYKKVCNLNIDLDISIDTDVVVNVRRKNTKGKTHEVEYKTPEKHQEVLEESDEECVEETPPTRASRKRKQALNGSDEIKPKTQRRVQKTVPKPSMRAGEYNGKKSKQ